MLWYVSFCESKLTMKRLDSVTYFSSLL